MDRKPRLPDPAEPDPRLGIAGGTTDGDFGLVPVPAPRPRIIPRPLPSDPFEPGLIGMRGMTLGWLRPVPADPRERDVMPLLTGTADDMPRENPLRPLNGRLPIMPLLPAAELRERPKTESEEPRDPAELGDRDPALRPGTRNLVCPLEREGMREPGAVARKLTAGLRAVAPTAADGPREPRLAIEPRAEIPRDCAVEISGMAAKTMAQHASNARVPRYEVRMTYPPARPLSPTLS